jgi:hypothetical protein
MGRPKKNKGAPAGFTPGKRLEREVIALDEGQEFIIRYEARRQGQSENGPFDLIECTLDGQQSIFFLKTDSARWFDGFDPQPETGDEIWVKRVENKGRMHQFQMAIRPGTDETGAPF